MFGLQFLAPLFLVAGAVAASVPLIIHLLNREKARRLVFSAIRFIKMSHQVNVQRHRLKQLILLLMRILILAMLGIAFARPFFAENPKVIAETGGKRNVAIIFDASYSMGYRDTFDRARKEVARIVDELQPVDASALIFVDDKATVIKPLNSEHSLIQSAVMGAELSNRSTNSVDAIQTADEILQQATLGQKQIYFVGDLQKIGWESFVETDRLSPDVKIAFIDVGANDAANLAITGVSAPQTTLNEQKPTQLTVRVQNSGDKAVEDVSVQLYIDGALVGTKVIDIEPNDAMDALFEVRFSTEEIHAGYAAIPDDGLAIDNKRYFLLQSLNSIKVHAVNGEPERQAYESETFFVKMALAQVGGRAGRRASAAPYSLAPFDFTESTQLPDNTAIRRYDVLILANVESFTESQAQTLKNYVGSGSGLIVAVGDRVDRDAYQRLLGMGDDPLMPCNFVQAVGDALDHEQFHIIATINYNHPIFSAFKDPNHGDFGKGRVYRYLQAAPLVNSTVLASFDDGSPALFEKNYGNGRVLCLTTTIDREWTDLPIRGVYLPFLHETVKYLALRRTEAQPDYRVGDLVELSGFDLPAEAEIAVFNPKGEETHIKVNAQGGALYEATDLPGLYSAHISGQPPRYFVVNLDAAESDLTSRDPEELISMLAGKAEAVASNVVTPETITQYHEEVEKHQGLWWYLMLGLFMLAVGEMFFANRI
jgi:hypothetical protein